MYIRAAPCVTHLTKYPRMYMYVHMYTHVYTFTQLAQFAPQTW